jgi:PKD repeat protein
MKIDTYGNIIWDKTYTEPNPAIQYDDSTYSFFKSVVEMDNGNLAVLNIIHNQYAAHKTKVYVLNSYGDSLWSKKYYSEIPYGDEILTVLKPTSDGGLIMSGYVESSAIEPTQQIWLVKTDCNGFDAPPAANFYDSLQQLEAIFINTSSKADSCIWDFGASASLSTLNASVNDTVFVTYSDTGHYTVTLIAYSSCDFADADTIIKEIYISDNRVRYTSLESKIRVFPNPAKETLYITKETNESLKFTLYDSYGKRILEKDLQHNRESINIQQLPAGIYLYQVQSNKNMSWGRVVIIQ